MIKLLEFEGSDGICDLGEGCRAGSMVTVMGKVW